MRQDGFDRLYELLGDRICKARQAAGAMSQSRLAGKIDVHRVSVVNIEKGRQRPPLHIIWKIAATLGVELSALMPTNQDFDRAATGVQLDADTIAQVQAATKNDPVAARQLTDFIQKAKARTERGDV